LPRLSAGLVALPPSKSHVLRALVLAAGAQRRVELRYGHGVGWEEAGDDIRAGLECARALGALVSVEGEVCLVEPAPQVRVGGILPVGEAGFLGRVVPTCAALSRSGRWKVDAVGSLRGRDSTALWDCLDAAGVAVDRGEGWLGAVEGPAELGALILRAPKSSQELSALWIGLACRGGGEVLVEGGVPSEPYLSLTRSVLAEFGAVVTTEDGLHRVTGVERGPAAVLDAEVDASAAAVALAAGCIAGVRVEVPGPRAGTAQGDWAIVEHLRAFGCIVDEAGENLVAVGRPLRGARLDLAGEPDLAPVIAIVAAAAAMGGGGSSLLKGLHTLDGKESRRGVVLEGGLQAAGFEAHWADPELSIGGGDARMDEVVLDPVGDHRMAFAFALLGLAVPGVRVSGGACTAKSWPRFWSAMGPRRDPEF
jgi:3-phosphoshikimate 1-carboxyvinyltransferase